jgi:Zinc knuckle
MRLNASRTEKGASAGNTQNKAGHNHRSDVTCYKCGKTGHISPNCPTNGPRVFVAHVIDEDAEEAPTENTHVQEGPEESEDRDESRSHDSEHNKGPTDDPNRSQYESELEGYILD